MLSRNVSNIRSNLLVVLLSLLSFCSANASYAQSACSLLQPAELESALAGKAGKFSDNTIGTTHMCTGQVGNRTVVIRVAERKDNSTTSKEQNAIEMLRKQGWKIDVKKDGNMTCSTAIPPAGSEPLGFNTTCSILNNGKVTALEVGSSSKEDMVSIDVVSALVKKAFSRL